MAQQGMTMKQFHRQQFLQAIKARNNAPVTSMEYVRASLEIHSLRGHVPRSMRRQASQI